MLHRVGIKRKSLSSYVQLTPPEVIEEIHAIADRLRGARILHLNSTAYSGGVAELLLSLVALEQDVGLDVEWQNISGIPLQMADGVGGYLITTVEQCAERVRIRDRFLLPRLLRDELRVFAALLSEPPERSHRETRA